MKRRIVFLLLLAGSLTDVAVLCADWVVMKGGHTVEVASVEVTAKAVTVITMNGKYWSMVRDAVDVPATLAANARVAADSVTVVEQPLPETTTPQSPPPRPPDPPVHPPENPTLPLPSPAPTSGQPRAALFVNGVLATSAPLGFAATRTFELFREDAFVNTRYSDTQAPGMEIGGVFLLKGPVGVRGSVELFRNDRSAAFEALLPHPFFFERSREISGRRSDLSHEEVAVHLGAVFSAHWGDAFFLDISGGPSLFITRTELIVDVLYEETFPYDSVTPLGATSTIFEQRPVGFNLGASATYRLAGAIGVDFGVRFSRARVQVSPADGGVVEFDAGGLQAVAGLRFLFR